MESLNEWLQPQYIWLIVGFILLLLEFAIPGLITAFFGFSAILVGVFAMFFDISVNTQLVIFIAMSVTSIISLRNWFLTFLGRNSSNIAAELQSEYIGQKVVVTKEIEPDRPGKVEFHGTNWEAEAGECIAEGKVVVITDKKNLTLTVEQI